MKEERRATALKGRRTLLFEMFDLSHLDLLLQREAVVNPLINAGITCRYDEEGGDSGEDDGTKRKKQFSDMFKKQMNIRKVNHNHQHTHSFFFFRSVCFL